MSSASVKTQSTEAPTFLKPNLPPVPLKYIPLPEPVLTLGDDVITITASEGMRAPCRRCLLDAQPGEILHLIPYDPFPPESVTPYRGTMAIFIHAHDCELFSGDKLPGRQLRRLMSVRAYDEKHMMVAAETVEGSELEKVAGGMLADEHAKYINVHNAKPGCFAVRVERA
jgi:hypothetical protein